MRALLLAALTALIPATASADWQYTEWGMSPDEVIAASNGAVKAKSPREGERVFGADKKALGFYEAAGYTFESEFFFDAADRLQIVKLVLLDSSKCGDLKDTVQGLYGQPAERSDISWVWYDHENQNKVRFTAVDLATDLSCFVLYTPIGGSGANGL